MARDSYIDDLTSVVVSVRGMLLSEQDATAAVAALARVAEQVIPSAAGAGVSLIDEAGHQVSAASTDSLVEFVDEVQYRLGQGPCLTAWATREPQRIDDMGEETRWAPWRAVALEAGVRAVLSIPLVYRGESLGALKVYARTAGAFAAEEERMLASLADAAATLLGAAQPVDAPQRLTAALQRALQSREKITLAAGVLMAREERTAEAAREELLRRARLQGRKMVDVAAQILNRDRAPKS